MKTQKTRLTRKQKIKKGNRKGSSKYHEKIQLQKRGIFSYHSPFKLSTHGISLNEMIRIRFKS